MTLVGKWLDNCMTTPWVLWNIASGNAFEYAHEPQYKRAARRCSAGKTHTVLVWESKSG